MLAPQHWACLRTSAMCVEFVMTVVLFFAGFLLAEGMHRAGVDRIIALMIFGLVLGIFVGVLPGLGGPNGVAILLPLTFTMDPTSAIVMLSCIYWGALFGGAITSILFNIPGEPWSVATTFDGYPMAQQGRAGEALTAAFTSSFVGAFVAVLMISGRPELLCRAATILGGIAALLREGVSGGRRTVVAAVVVHVAAVLVAPRASSCAGSLSLCNLATAFAFGRTKRFSLLKQLFPLASGISRARVSIGTSLVGARESSPVASLTALTCSMQVRLPCHGWLTCGGVGSRLFELPTPT